MLYIANAMYTQLYDQFISKFHQPHEFQLQAPGRVNLIGEHVDYNDGPVLPAAIDREVTFLAARNETTIVHLHALDLNQEIHFSMENLELKRSRQGIPLPDWAIYPAGVAWSLQKSGIEPMGIDVLYTSNIPIGAGLSSSAAIEVGFARLWVRIAGLEMGCLELAQLCQWAESQYVGVSVGLMDQFAAACGIEGHALYFDTRSLAWQPLPFPDTVAIVIADSGIRRNLADSLYNQRRSACEQAVEMLRSKMPEIKSLRDVPTTEFMAYSPYLPDELRKRAEHVVKEIARVESAVNALVREDFKIFGALMYASHNSLCDLYEVSTPELDTLVGLTRKIQGCYGARLTGAGFGGCTVNLVDSSQAESFIHSLKYAYQNATGIQAQVYLCHASQGARFI